MQHQHGVTSMLGLMQCVPLAMSKCKQREARLKESCSSRVGTPMDCCACFIPGQAMLRATLGLKSPTDAR